MILTGDLHASPEELRFLKPEYLRNKFGSKAENTIIVILGDGGFSKTKSTKMQEVKRDHLNLVQIAKSQNIPYCKLYHVYLMIGLIPDAVKVCRKNREYLEHYTQYLREWKKKPKNPKEPKHLSEIAKENGIPLGCLMQRLEK